MSLFILQKHIFPKYTLFALPPPKFWKTVVLQIYYSLLFQYLFQEKLNTMPSQFILEGGKQGVLWECAFFNIIPSLTETFHFNKF